MKRIIRLYLIFFVIFSFLQNIDVVSIGGVSVKLIHLYSLAGIILILKKKILFPNKWINIVYLFLFLISMLGYAFYGFNSLLINYLFGYYVLFLLINLLDYFSFDEKLEIIQKGTIISFVIIFVNVLYNISSIIEYLNNPYGGHPVFDFIIQGGANIEASWIAAFSLIFYNKGRKKYIPVIFSLLLSTLYGSRSALIMDAIILLIYMWEFIKKRKKFLMFTLSAIIVSFIILMQFNSFSILIERFLNVGSEAGSLGRLNMWLKFIPTFKNNIFGYGCGNATKAISKVYNQVIPDDNMHNLILQYGLDFGIFGLFIIISIYCYFANKVFINKTTNIYCKIIMLYYFIGLIQFRGGEIFYFILISYFISTSVNESKRKVYESIINNA